MATIYIRTTARYSQIRSNCSEYDSLPIREAIPAMMRTVNLDPMMKMTLNRFDKPFALPDEKFGEWRSGSRTMFLEEVQPNVKIVISGRNSATISREALVQCSTLHDLWEFATDKGWLRRGEVIRSITVDQRVSLDPIIFHSEFNNLVVIYTTTVRTQFLSSLEQPRRSVPEISSRVPHLAPQDSTCVICQEDLFRENCKELRRIDKCGHHFHATCIGEWLATSTTCPLCRAEI